jgi:hypothetical protein
MFRSYDHHQVEKYMTTLRRTTETYSYVYISNILTYDSDVAQTD